MTFKVVTESGEVFAPMWEPEKRAERLPEATAQAIADWFSGGVYGTLTAVSETPEPAERDYAGEFAAALTEKFKEHASHYTKAHFSVRRGKRFDKIAQHNEMGGGSRVHAFVEKSTGHVYKAAGWDGPAKGVRFTTIEEAIEKADMFGTYLYKK